MRLNQKSFAGAMAAGMMLSMAVLPALGAEAEGATPIDKELKGAVGTAVVTILIFLCLFIVLRAVAWKPILKGLQARETAIRDSVEAAAKARAEAERMTKELESRIAEAQKQGQQQLMQAKADAQKLAEQIREKAEAEAAALRDRALRDIDGAKQQALAEINSHAAELGTAIARKILQRSVTVEDQGRLVEESLAELAAKN